MVIPPSVTVACSASVIAESAAKLVPGGEGEEAAGAAVPGVYLLDELLAFTGEVAIAENENVDALIEGDGFDALAGGQVDDRGLLPEFPAEFDDVEGLGGDTGGGRGLRNGRSR